MKLVVPEGGYLRLRHAQQTAGFDLIQATGIENPVHSSSKFDLRLSLFVPMRLDADNGRRSSARAALRARRRGVSRSCAAHGLADYTRVDINCRKGLSLEHRPPSRASVL